jgi:hypothetical protein
MNFSEIFCFRCIFVFKTLCWGGINCNRCAIPCCLQQKLTCSNEFRLNIYFLGWQLILKYIFLTNQSIFRLWILSHESLKITGFEGDLMTLNTRLEINLFMCIFKGWVLWVTFVETKVCPSITSHGAIIFFHNGLRHYC